MHGSFALTLIVMWPLAGARSSMSSVSPRPHAKGGTIGGVSDDPTPQDCAELTDRRRVPDSIFEI